MKKVVNGVVIVFSIILIGFVTIFSLLPKVTLDVFVTIGGYAIPIIVILITMIIEIKKSKDTQEKDKIRMFWLKILFIIYCLLLITILFLNNAYRVTVFQNVNIFSKEHFETSNIVPFGTIIEYINRLINQNIRASIVILNLVTNLLLFTPMGFFIPILFKNKIKNTKQFILMMVVITLFVEILQFITYRGTTDIDDIILNTIGAVLVYELMKTKFLKKILEKTIDITY